MNIAIILAGGKGERLNPKIPKQFIVVNERPILYYSLKTFNNNINIDKIVLVTNKNHEKETENFLDKNKFNKIESIVFGGKTRKDSVFNALEHLKENNVNSKDIIVIHDSARAMIDDATINKCISKAKEYGASTAAKKTTDTIINSNGEKIISHLDRDFLYNVQTPQCFRFEIIYKAHIKNPHLNSTDDTFLVKSIGEKVHIVLSNNSNIKITTSDDIYFFESYLKNNKKK